MNMMRTKKDEFVQGFTDRLSQSSNLYVTDFTGLNGSPGGAG